MSNIHGFHNLGARAPGPSQSNGGGGYGGWRRQDSQSLPMPVGMAAEPEGISMMVPPPRPDGRQPELSERIFPRMCWKSMTTFVSILDVVMFIITLIVGAAEFDGAFVKGNDMGGPSTVTLCHMGGKWEPSIQAGHVWRLFTAILLHAGFLHIASNLFFQLRFGYVTEARWGSGRWIAVYVLAGLMASLWSTVMGPKSVSVGASGALFGIVGADLTYLAYNWAVIPHKQQEACFIIIITVINLLLGISGNVDNYAHLGGLVGGFFLGIAIPPHLVERAQVRFIRSAAAALYAGMFLLFLLLIYAGDGPWPEYMGERICPKLHY